MWRWNIILIAFIIGNFISTIFLIIQSEKKDNKIGIIIGYILMIFLLFFPITLYLVGKYFVEYYKFIFIFIFGILILYIVIILSIGLTTNVNENFTLAQGICNINGKMGYVINGECDISNTKNCDSAVKESIKKNCPDNASKSMSKSSSRGLNEGGATEGSTDSATDNNLISKNEQEKFTTPPMGLCSYKDNNQIKFGYRHPDYGAACISKDKMLKAIKSNPKQILKGVSYSSTPFQSTECQKYPKNDYISFDLACKKKFGLKYGLKIVENQGCAQNDYRAICEQDWQAGVKLPENSTKCVPIGKDMNVQCQIKHVDNPGKFGKYLKIGYKTIDFSGCPKGSQRAICDGNYYDGKELYKKTTAPFPQTENPNRKCQADFGLLSFAKKIISENCAVGYIRAECN